MENGFLAEEQIITFGGAVSVVTLGTNTISYAFQKNPKYIGLIFSTIIYCGFNFADFDLMRFSSYALFFANICILYLSAVGASEIGTRAVETSSTGATEENDGSSRFWIRWW